MKAFILATIVSLVIAGQAQALSCLRPDVARTFAQAAGADESYLILQGTFTFTPPTATNTAAQMPATFHGQYLAADGFVDAPPLDVTLAFTCVSAWCGSLNAGESAVAFVQQSPDGYLLRVDPCHSTVFAASDLTVQRVTSCMRGTGCAEAAF